MLEVRIARIYRETLTATEEKEVGASDLTEEIKQIVKRSRITDEFRPSVFGRLDRRDHIDRIRRRLDARPQGRAPAIDPARPQLLPWWHPWQDGNAHAHLRATLLGPQLMVPVSNGSPDLGTRQQIACVNLDSRTRERKIVVTVFGD